MLGDAIASKKEKEVHRRWQKRIAGERGKLERVDTAAESVFCVSIETAESVLQPLSKVNL